MGFLRPPDHRTWVATAAGAGRAPVFVIATRRNVAIASPTFVWNASVE